MAQTLANAAPALVLAVLSATLTTVGCSSARLDGPNNSPTPREPGDSPALGRALGDGTLGSVDLTEVYRPNLDVPLSATALAFNGAASGELWVALRQHPSGKPCTEDDNSGCSALQGVMAIVSNVTGDAAAAEVKEDGNSWHFMRRPTAIAWGVDALFATCGEAFTANYENAEVPYAGPVLWSSDPAIFGAKPTAGQNGKHLDMLHESPYCMGIAHESSNIYWVVNGHVGSVDRYDFNSPHQIGGDDHNDGEVFRYIAGQLSRVPEVPSHAVFDQRKGVLYVADTGNGRVLSVNPKTATRGGEIQVWETLAASGEMVGAEVLELVPPGVLERPSGVALVGDVLYVTDNATSVIHAFDLAGDQLTSLDTELPAGTVAGIAAGTDDKLYFTDLLSGAVRRIDPK